MLPSSNLSLKALGISEREWKTDSDRQVLLGLTTKKKRYPMWNTLISSQCRSAQVFIKVPNNNHPCAERQYQFQRTQLGDPGQNTHFIYQVQQTTYSQYNQFLERFWTGVLQHQLLDEFSTISFLSIAVKISKNVFAFR